MRVEASVVQGLVEQANRLQLAAVAPADCGRINVAAELQATRERLAQRIDTHLQPWFVLLDECIQFFVQFERYLYESPLPATSRVSRSPHPRPSAMSYLYATC